MILQNIMKELALKDVQTSIGYDKEEDVFYLDLQTNAKSHRYLYENGVIKGRYGYESKIELNDNIKQLIIELCYEFYLSLHGRDYGQGAWVELCEKNGIKINKNN